jgi:hypothetical protein
MTSGQGVRRDRCCASAVLIGRLVDDKKWLGKPRNLHMCAPGAGQDMFVGTGSKNLSNTH